MKTNVHRPVSLGKRGIAHVGLKVSDVNKSEKFYHDLLGLKVTLKKAGQTFLASGPDLLVLYQDRGSNFHFGFRLDSPPKVEAWKNWLKANNIPIREDISKKNHPRSFKVRDPDGYWVEISSRG